MLKCSTFLAIWKGWKISKDWSSRQGTVSLQRKLWFISFTFKRSIIRITAAYLIGARLLAIDDRLIVIVARKMHPTATPPYPDESFGQELLAHQISSRSIAIFGLFFFNLLQYYGTRTQVIHATDSHSQRENGGKGAAALLISRWLLETIWSDASSASGGRPREAL